MKHGLQLKFIFSASLLLFLMALAELRPPVWAQDVISQEEPTPSSVNDVTTPMERSFKEKPPLPRRFPWVEEKLKDTPAFIRDTRVNLNLRTFEFYRDKFDDSKSEAWALGGALSYQSGLLFDRFSLGSVLYTSQKLYGPEDRDGTLILKPGQQGYTVVGQLYGRVKLFEGNFLNIYRSEYNTPFINKDDSRMTPNTFEGYTFQGSYEGKEGDPGFTYGGGYIAKIKERDSDRFTWMSQDAGAKVKRGVFLGGGTFSYGGLRIGAIDYYSEDIMNIGYAEATYMVSATKELGLLFTAQFTDQRSVGEDLLKGYSFNTNQFGVKGEMSYGGGILTLGYTAASKEADLQSPWGGHPGYTTVQVQQFNRAGENAFLSKLSYNFKRVGLESVTASVLLVHGWGRVDPATKDHVPDENEFNGDLQWRPQWKFLKGLWFRTRYSHVHQYEGSGDTINDFRVIVNYDVSLM